MKYYYILTEGVHDVEFIGRLLKIAANATRIIYKDKVDSFWHPLLPTRFPQFTTQDIVKRINIPAFFQNEDLSVAVHPIAEKGLFFKSFDAACIAISNFKTKIKSLGIFADSDFNGSIQSKHDSITDQFSKEVNFPQKPGEINSSSPSSGVFLFPNNKDHGTIEDLLIECCELEYNHLLKNADNFLTNIDLNTLCSNDKKEIYHPAGLNKATLGAIASIIKPGKAIQMAIQDLQIVTPKTTSQCNAVEALNFIKKLLE